VFAGNSFASFLLPKPHHSQKQASGRAFAPVAGPCKKHPTIRKNSPFGRVFAHAGVR
jgi:hypothetical protein